jgi:hypothetical protein
MGWAAGVISTTPLTKWPQVILLIKGVVITDEKAWPVIAVPLAEPVIEKMLSL